MRVIVIPANKFISVDGHGIAVPALDAPENVQAYRFEDEGTATVEYTNGYSERLKEPMALRKKYVQMHGEAVRQAEALLAQEQADEIAAVAEAQRLAALPPPCVGTLALAIAAMTEEEILKLEETYDASGRFRFIWDDPSPVVSRLDLLIGLLVPLYGEARTHEILRVQTSASSEG